MKEGLEKIFLGKEWSGGIQSDIIIIEYGKKKDWNNRSLEGFRQ
mgnify:CR=1 FL=1